MDGVLDGALGFVGVRAVGELAEGDIGAELDEVAFEGGGIDAPEFELAEAGGVDDVAAGVEADQLGGGGGVLALGGPVGDLADAEVQARLDRVQKRALADAALAREGGRAGLDQLAEAADSPAVGGRGQDGLVAELGVEADDPLVEARVDAGRPCSGRSPAERRRPRPRSGSGRSGGASSPARPAPRRSGSGRRWRRGRACGGGSRG